METGEDAHGPSPTITPDDVHDFFLDASGLAEKEADETDDRFLAGILCTFCADILNDSEVAESWRRQIGQYIRSQR